MGSPSRAVCARAASLALSALSVSPRPSPILRRSTGFDRSYAGEFFMPVKAGNDFVGPSGSQIFCTSNPRGGGAGDFGDYDGDGDLDLVTSFFSPGGSGYTGANGRIELWQNGLTQTGTATFTKVVGSGAEGTWFPFDYPIAVTKDGRYTEINEYTGNEIIASTKIQVCVVCAPTSAARAHSMGSRAALPPRPGPFACCPGPFALSRALPSLLMWRVCVCAAGDRICGL